jgi:hypothetical protein
VKVERERDAGVDQPAQLDSCHSPEGDVVERVALDSVDAAGHADVVDGAAGLEQVDVPQPLDGPGQVVEVQLGGPAAGVAADAAEVAAAADGQGAGGGQGDGPDVAVADRVGQAAVSVKLPSASSRRKAGW